MARHTEPDPALCVDAHRFGPQLRRYRAGAGLTQRALADLSTISVRTIRDLEQGRTRPRADTVRLIADALRLGRQARTDLAQAAGRGAGSSRPLHQDYDATLAAPPVVLDGMIGRDAEAGNLVAELTGGASRLITVAGPPGVGKTRLAVEVASMLHRQRRVPVLWLCAPGTPHAVEQPARDHRLVALLHAATTELFEPSNGARAVTDLADLVAGRETLMVLDGVGARPPSDADLLCLLQDCPRLRVLVTATRLTGLPGERPFLLGPLPVPAETDERQAAPSVRLFLDHLCRVRPDHRLSAKDAATVAEICRLLDGLPPALASAASWLAVFDLEPLRDALFTDPFAFLDPTLASRLTDWVAVLPTQQRMLLDRLRDLGEVTLPEVAAATGATVQEAGQLMRELLQHGVIRLRQAGGHTRFQVLALVNALDRIAHADRVLAR
jgi:transcriptional regulator with XRE-family HTH domain